MKLKLRQTQKKMPNRSGRAFHWASWTKNLLMGRSYRMNLLKVYLLKMRNTIAYKQKPKLNKMKDKNRKYKVQRDHGMWSYGVDIFGSFAPVENGMAFIFNTRQDAEDNIKEYIIEINEGQQIEDLEKREHFRIIENK